MNFRSKEQYQKVESSIQSIIMKGFQQATDLTILAKSLKIAINPEFEKLVLIENVPKIVNLKDITLHILGPSEKNLKKFREEWKDKSKSRI